MNFCKFCGEELKKNGRCPWKDCPHNAIMDVLGEDEKDEKETGEKDD